MTMELSHQALDGLQIAGDSAHIPDNLFKQLLPIACNVLVNQSRSETLPEKGANAGSVKAAFSALVTLLLEAAKHDVHTEALSHVLEDCKFASNRTELFCKHYQENKEKLRILLSSTGSSLPHIVDVDWRVQHYIKNDKLDKVSQPVFLINLKTEECGEIEPKTVQLSCNQEQLQDLVGKLRDACKSLERAAQM